MILGISWYKPEDWARIKEISEDREALDDTYDEWRQNANQTIQELQATGRVVKRVNINPEELLFWCNEREIPVNGESRSSYVSAKLQEKVRHNK